MSNANNSQWWRLRIGIAISNRTQYPPQKATVSNIASISTDTLRFKGRDSPRKKVNMESYPPYEGDV